MMIVKEREILSIPIKKNKFMEDYEFEQMKRKNDSHIQYNQKIYFKAPNNVIDFPIPDLPKYSTFFPKFF